MWMTAIGSGRPLLNANAFIFLPVSKAGYPLSDLHPEPKWVSAETLKSWNSWMTYEWKSTKKDARKASMAIGGWIQWTRREGAGTRMTLSARRAQR